MRYIGSKANLLKEIDKVLSKHLTGREKSFVDLFAGTNIVGQFFKSRFEITSNDLLLFSQIISKATIELNEIPSFKKLEILGIKDPFQYFQTVNLDDYKGGFITNAYSPASKEGRMYFTVENAKRIDFIRTTIDKWLDNKLIDQQGFNYILSSLIQAVPFVSNITGTYGAYLKHWDKRAFKRLELVPNKVINNGQNNRSLRGDAVKLVKNMEKDILYIDTPYNNRQYASNYHVLETIARYDNPKIHGVTGQRNVPEEKSEFAMKTKAKQAMAELLSDLNFSHVVVSYSTEGIISEQELIGIMKKNALNEKVEVVRIPYRKYKSKNDNSSKQLYELIFYFQPIKAKYITKKDNNYKLRQPRKINSDRIGGFIKSPLNYIGGKYKLLPQLIPLFPTNIDVFLDLFSGGGNVGINVPSSKVYFNDLNNKINEMFRFFQGKDPELLVQCIKKRIAEFNLTKTNEKAFLEFRKMYNEKPNPLDLYILAAYSFNYQFRFNNNMKYNNPFGRNRSHFSYRMEENLVRFVQRLNNINAVFTDEYFNNFDTSMLTKRSFVYADPPYLITTGSYNDGNRGFTNWTEVQEQQLYNFLDDINKRKIKFAMSNVIEHKGRSNEMLKNWSKKYNVHVLNYNYRNSSHNTSQLGSIEVLITNY